MASIGTGQYAGVGTNNLGHTTLKRTIIIVIFSELASKKQPKTVFGWLGLTNATLCRQL